jgi:hypothetical protein
MVLHLQLALPLVYKKGMATLTHRHHHHHHVANVSAEAWR